MKASEKHFLKGFAAVVGWLARDRNEGSLADYALKDMGVSLGDLNRAGVEPFDLTPIRRVVAGRAPAGGKP